MGFGLQTARTGLRYRNPVIERTARREEGGGSWEVSCANQLELTCRCPISSQVKKANPATIKNQVASRLVFWKTSPT
jgi:hypothetical protein